MAWINTGDAPNKKTPRVEFQPREVKSVNVTSAFPTDLHEELMTYCDSRRLSAAALIRYLVAKELRG